MPDIAGVAIFVALRWVSFERYIEKDGRPEMMRILVAFIPTKHAR